MDQEEKVSQDKIENNIDKPREEEDRSSVPSKKINNQSNPISNYVSTHTHYSKESDDLLDVRIGNPLEKITKLLEEIKKQKAFSFTLKGSLGIAGVALALSVFGVFGGGKILCDKGLQTHVGVLKVLSYQEIEPWDVPLISSFLDSVAPKNHRNRIVLLKNDESILAVPHPGNIAVMPFIGKKVTVTGNYNSCNQKLTVSDPMGIEVYQ